MKRATGTSLRIMPTSCLHLHLQRTNIFSTEFTPDIIFMVSNDDYERRFSPTNLPAGSLLLPKRGVPLSILVFLTRFHTHSNGTRVGRRECLLILLPELGYLTPLIVPSTRFVDCGLYFNTLKASSMNSADLFPSITSLCACF